MTTISMSETDYAIFRDAAAWIHLHSGVDAPEYAGLDLLHRTVDAIAKRRPTRFDDSPREPRAHRSDLVAELFDLGDRQETGGSS